MAKRRKRAKKTQPRTADIRPDLLKFIETAFPDGIVEWPLEWEDDDLEELYETVAAKLRTLPQVGFFHERRPASSMSAWDEDDDDEDPFADSRSTGDMSYSYRCYFLGLADPKARITEQDEEEDEDGNLVEVERTDALGCVVGLCEFAPLAVVRVQSMSYGDEWGCTILEISDHNFELDGGPAAAEAHLSNAFGSDAIALARQLREKIIGVLEPLGVTVIPDDEARKTVPWLEAGDEAILESDSMGRPITVLDAFFFMMP
jgi:hypothetical protein